MNISQSDPDESDSLIKCNSGCRSREIIQPSSLGCNIIIRHPFYECIEKITQTALSIISGQKRPKLPVRLWIRAFIVFLTIFTLTSCNVTTISPPSDSSSVSAQDSISFRITWLDYSGRGEAIRKIVNLYNAGSEGDTLVSLLGGDEDLSAIEKLIRGDGVDTVYVLPYRYVKYFGEKGYLMDLTSEFMQEKDLIYPKLWDLGTLSDVTYGIPWLSHSVCLIYNKDLLDKAGVNASSIQSRYSLVEALEKVVIKTTSKGIGLVGADHNDVSWMVNQFIYGFGSSLVSEDGKKVAVNNALAKEALEFYKNVLGRYAQPTWTEDTGVEVMDAFRNQEIAFEFQGIWGVTDIEKNGNPFEVGIINLESIGLYPEVGPMMLAIPAGFSEDKKADAIAFIRYMISKKAQEMIMDGEYSPEHGAYYPFRVPVRIDLKDSLIMKKYPQYLPFIEGFTNPSIDVPVPAWQTIKDEYYAPGLHKVMSGEMTIDGFLQQIETEGDKILAAAD